MMALIASMKTHYEIPATFDGELPSSLDRASSSVPCLRFGGRYVIPGAAGEELVGRFYNATVDTASGVVYGAYQLEDGRHIIATNTLAAEELDEYVRYPDTFFDGVLKPGCQAKTFVDLCDVLFESYKATPREKLLEFMANAPDIQQLRTLGQRDLAIAFVERVASNIRARLAPA